MLDVATCLYPHQASYRKIDHILWADQVFPVNTNRKNQSLSDFKIYYVKSYWQLYDPSVIHIT